MLTWSRRGAEVSRLQLIDRSWGLAVDGEPGGSRIRWEDQVGL